jgi:hypothetical protein
VTRWRAVVAAGALVVALAGCTVEVVDADQDPAPTRDAPAAPRAPEAEPVVEPDAEPEVQPSRSLPGRADLRPLTTGQTACGDNELSVDRAGAAVEVTDACAVLTVAGADAVVVADDVGQLVVTGAGAQVAVRGVSTVTIEAADVTVTWEEGAPVVAGDTPGSSYGAVDPG